MKINWNPSPTVAAFAKYINEQKKTKSYEVLVEETGYSRNYIIALNNWYRQEVTKDAK